MVIAYCYKKNLYLNITNRCTNRCVFCIKNYSYVLAGYNLKLNREPTREEIIKNALNAHCEEQEIVFCGMGEPLIRLDDVIYVAKKLKVLGTPMRVNTNGQAKLLYPNRNVAEELSQSIKAISISLNAENEEKYNLLCRPQFPNAYQKILEFAKECVEHLDTTLSVVDLPEIDVEKCRCIAADLGAKFLVRTASTK